MLIPGYGEVSLILAAEAQKAGNMTSVHRIDDERAGEEPFVDLATTYPIIAI